jgi:hypothetical protein
LRVTETEKKGESSFKMINQQIYKQRENMREGKETMQNACSSVIIDF